MQKDGWGKNVQGKGDGGGANREIFNLLFDYMSDDISFHFHDVLAFDLVYQYTSNKTIWVFQNCMPCYEVMAMLIGGFIVEGLAKW